MSVYTEIALLQYELEKLRAELVEKDAEVEKRTIERCASFVDDSCTYGDTHILVKAVRALPTGQIKLEELL